MSSKDLFQSRTALYLRNWKSNTFSIICRLYAMFRMVGCVKAELKSMKHGLYNVIPMDLLSGITAEVGGSHAPLHLGPYALIFVHTAYAVTSFHHLCTHLLLQDFQLLLSGGSENITMSMLKSCFRFQHSHSGSKNIVQRFER